MKEILEKVTYYLNENLKDFHFRKIGFSILGAFILANISLLSFEYFFQPKVSIVNEKIKDNPDAPGTVFFDNQKPTLSNTDKDVIIKRNIFNIEGKTGEESDAKESKNYEKDQIIKSELPLKLLGTIYGGDAQSGLALIEHTTKKSINSFLVGDAVMDRIILLEVLREKIILKVDDHREYIEVQKPKLKEDKRKSKPNKAASGAVYALEPTSNEYKEDGFERKGTEITLSKDFRQKMLTTDFAKVLQDAKAEPYMENGELSGFRLTKIKNDSIYQKSGLQDDDIIREINGVSLVDTAQTIKLLNSLRGESEIELRLTRDGRNLTVNMQVR